MAFLLQQLINGLSRGAVYALIAVGFALIFSVLKFSNFAHGGLISICAFAGYYFSGVLMLNPLFSVILTAAVGAVMGVFLDCIAFRNLRKHKSPHLFYFVSSITAGILFENVLTVLFGTTFYSIPPFFKDATFHVGKVIIVKTDVTIFLICAVSLALLMLIIKKTKLGLSVRMISMDEDTAKLMGVNSDNSIIVTFMMAGALGGMAGIFLGVNFTVDPFIGDLVVKGFVASVIGGLGSLEGACVAALLLGVVEVILTTMFGDVITPAIVFAVTLLFLLVRPQGISGKLIQEKA